MIVPERGDGTRNGGARDHRAPGDGGRDRARRDPGQPGRSPAWLVAAGRATGLRRRAAQTWLLVAAGLMLLALAVAQAPAADPIDPTLDIALVDGVRHGGDYYTVAAEAAHGLGLPTAARTIPLPTLFAFTGGVPAPIAGVAVMLLAVLVVLAWYARFGMTLRGRRARMGALLLVLVGVAVALRPTVVAMPEGWAGLLVALSLARAAPGRTAEPVALGIAAAMLTPAALPYPLVMLIASWRDGSGPGGSGPSGSGRALAGWSLALVMGVAAVALHARALALAAPAGIDAVAADGAGLPAALTALGWATGLRALPFALALPLMVLALLGWASRREAVAIRVVALVIVQAGVIAALGMASAALVVAPLLPLGLLAVPDAARALLAAALDRRRITVTRIVRGGPVP